MELVLKFGFVRFETSPLHFLPAPMLALGFTSTSEVEMNESKPVKQNVPPCKYSEHSMDNKIT